MRAESRLLRRSSQPTSRILANYSGWISINAICLLQRHVRDVRIMNCWRCDIVADYVARVIGYHLYSGLRIKAHVHLDACLPKPRRHSDFPTYHPYYSAIFASISVECSCFEMLNWNRVIILHARPLGKRASCNLYEADRSVRSYDINGLSNYWNCHDYFPTRRKKIWCYTFKWRTC